MEKFKIVILISGRGSNLNAIVKKFSKKNSYVEVVGVISGMVLDNFQDIKQNDILESYFIEEQKRSL